METKKCIHSRHPVHSEKKKPLDIPIDAEYCIYCGLPQYDMSEAIENIKQVVDEFKKGLAEFSPSPKQEINEKDPIMQKTETAMNKLMDLGNRIEALEKTANEGNDIINKLCQALLDITNQDPDMRKFGESVHSFTSNLVKEVSYIIIDECLSEGKRLMQILALVIEVNALLGGKADFLVEKIKKITDEAKMSIEDYDPASFDMIPFADYISQNARDFVKISPVDMYLKAVKDMYAESLHEFAKRVNQNISKWRDVWSKRDDIEFEKIVKNDIPILFKIIEAEKDVMKDDIKIRIEEKWQELFRLSGLSEIDLTL